jgi:hypothetical protein
MAGQFEGSGKPPWNQAIEDTARHVSGIPEMRGGTRSRLTGRGGTP